MYILQSKYIVAGVNFKVLLINKGVNSFVFSTHVTIYCCLRTCFSTLKLHFEDAIKL